MKVFVRDKPDAELATRKSVMVLGKGRLGHVYLDKRGGDPFGRWEYAAHDIAVALAVTGPRPAKPAGPDWGRMVCRILAECLRESEKTESLQRVLAGVPTGPPHQQHMRIYCESNLVPPTKIAGAARKDPESPYYRVGLSVRPAGETGQLDLTVTDRSIRWDGKAAVRGYAVQRLGVEIGITVMSDDAEFVKAINAILDQEVSRALRRSNPPVTQPATQPKRTAAELLKEFKNAEYSWKQGNVGEELIALDDNSVIPEMIEMLKSKDRCERCNAARVLAGHGDQRGLAAVLAELKDTGAEPALTAFRSNGTPHIQGQIKSDCHYAVHLLACTWKVQEWNRLGVLSSKHRRES